MIKESRFTNDRMPWLLQQWRFHRSQTGFKDMKFPSPHKQNHDWHLSQMNYYYLEMQKVENDFVDVLEPKPYHIYKYEKRSR